MMERRWRVYGCLIMHCITHLLYCSERFAKMVISYNDKPGCFLINTLGNTHSIPRESQWPYDPSNLFETRPRCHICSLQNHSQLIFTKNITEKVAAVWQSEMCHRASFSIYFGTNLITSNFKEITYRLDRAIWSFFFTFKWTWAIGWMWFLTWSHVVWT